MTNSWGNNMRNEEHQWDVAYVLLRQSLEKYRKVQCYQPILSEYYHLFLKEGITDREDERLQEISEQASSDRTLKILLSLIEEECYRKLGYSEPEALAESENIRAKSVDLILRMGVPATPAVISPRTPADPVAPAVVKRYPIQCFLRRYCLPLSVAVSSGVFALGLSHGAEFVPDSFASFHRSHISRQSSIPSQRASQPSQDIQMSQPASCGQQEARYTDPRLEGDTTAYDEKLDNAKLTVAHPFLPPGSVLSVSNGSKSVDVTVNDSIPSRKEPTFSVTWQAASELDMLEEGVEQVDVRSVFINQAETQQLSPVQRASLNAFSQKCSSLIVASAL